MMEFRKIQTHRSEFECVWSSLLDTLDFPSVMEAKLVLPFRVFKSVLELR